jgi:glycosyltransferase involved in cell wall biosynthesis
MNAARTEGASMRKDLPLSFLMLTYNEELNLARSLPMLAGWATDIVVVDSFSTDRTVDIAQSYGARVVQRKFTGHAEQWAWAMKNVPLANEWIFMHDPDHRVTPELKDELMRMFATGIRSEVDGLYVKRRNVFQGKWIRHGGYYPIYMLKIVRRDRVFFDEHEFDYRAYVPGQTLALAHDIVEENVKEENISFWIDKHNRFAVRQAEEELFRANNPSSWKVRPSLFGSPDQRTLWLKVRWYRMPLFVRPFVYFFYRYVIRLGFFDGKEGFVFHFMQALWYRLLVDINVKQLRTARAAASVSATEVVK